MVKIDDIDITGIAEEVIKDLKEREEKVKKLISDDKYILWLEKFTEKYPTFSDDSWNYKEDELSKEDLEKVHNLQYFFKGIEDYAELNHIKFNTIDNGFYNYYYLVKYNNVGYRLFLMAGQGTFISCTRINDSSKDFINFKDILRSNNQEATKTINGYLKELKYVVDDLVAMGVSKEMIRQYVNNMLQ